MLRRLPVRKTVLLRSQTNRHLCVKCLSSQLGQRSVFRLVENCESVGLEFAIAHCDQQAPFSNDDGWGDIWQDSTRLSDLTAEELICEVLLAPIQRQTFLSVVLKIIRSFKSERLQKDHDKYQNAGTLPGRKRDNSSMARCCQGGL